ncbi:MAG: hypothetical protein AB7S68_30125 [Polyangiaceae bacterium]
MRLTLDQYARVTQALGLHRFPPEAVFAAEQITAEQWEAVKVPLELQLADAEPESDLLERAGEASERALIKLKRRIMPLDDDAVAWFGFLKAYSESQEPIAFLSRVGLREIDLLGLQQHWGKRLPEMEPELRLAAVSAPATVPEIHVEMSEYPIPEDPIGPMPMMDDEVPEEPSEDEVPIFGTIPEDD